MKLHLKNIIFNCLLIFAIGITLFSCISPSGPNKPFSGLLPESLEIMAERNLQLAVELRRLPEIIDGINDYEEAILNKLLVIYEKYPNEFDKAFSEMNKTGKIAYRKYCTPLQALFWFAENGDIYEITSLIKDYKLQTLLSASWNFQTKFEIEKIELSESQASHILSFVDKKKIWYAKHQKSNLKTLLYCYNHTPEAIPKRFRTEIENMPEVKSALHRFKNNQKRWIDTQAVIDRLNDPILFDFYVNKNIIYKHIAPNRHTLPSTIIKDKYGDCDDLANFGKIVLSKAGYDVFGRFYNKYSIPNHIILGIKLKDGSYFKAVDFGRNGNSMGGPYKTILEIDQSGGYGIWYTTREFFFFHW